MEVNNGKICGVDMPDKETIINGVNAMESLLNEQARLQKDAIMFIVEKDLWDEFMKFHINSLLERNKEKKG